MAFSVLDAQGCLKVKPGGAGATLADPLTATHGGTGLTHFSQADMIVSWDDNTWVALEKDTDLGQTPAKVMCNLQFPGSSSVYGPRWGTLASVITTGLIQPAAYIFGGSKTYALQARAGSSIASATIGMTSASATGATQVTDATTTWTRMTTLAAAGDCVGWRAGATMFWSTHEFEVGCKFRTPSDITNVRIVFALSNVSGALFNGTSEDFSISKFLGIRYSTGASDTDWTSFLGTGSGQFTSSMGVAIAASTVYTAKIKVTRVTAGSYNVTLTVDSTSVTFGISPDVLFTALEPSFGITTLVAGTRFIDCTAAYLLASRNQIF